MLAPGERDLRALSEQFSKAESEIVALLVRAPGGDRRQLLGQALELLAGLRQQDFRRPVAVAYLTALRGASRTARRDPEAVRDLAGALAVKLDAAAQTAAEGSRQAFRDVTADTLEEMATTAVTAHVDAAGKRWSLGHYAQMTTSTIGRWATSAGTVSGVGRGLVIVEGSSSDEICGPLIGLTFPAESAPEPPFHAGCACMLSPV